MNNFNKLLHLQYFLSKTTQKSLKYYFSKGVDRCLGVVVGILWVYLGVLMCRRKRRCTGKPTPTPTPTILGVNMPDHGLHVISFNFWYENTKKENKVALANSTNGPVSKFQLSKALANRTQQAILFSQSQISTESDALSATNDALLGLKDTEIQIQILILIVSQTIVYTPESDANIAQLIQLVTDMESTATNMSDALNLTLLVAKSAKEAAIRADEAQAIALQAAIKASRLALCYPNPCLNGGMCAASPDNSSFTCFCSSLYKGTKCQDLKITSVFNAGKGFSNYESMIREDKNPQI